MREEHARVKSDQALGDTRRAEQLKRLDGVATILAKTAVRDSGLLALLSEDAVVTDAARSLTREMLRDFGVEPAPEQVQPAEPVAAPAVPERRVVPQSVVSRQLANPFLAPDFSAARPSAAPTRRLATWELLGPLFSSFERAGRRRSPARGRGSPAGGRRPSAAPPASRRRRGARRTARAGRPPATPPPGPRRATGSG